MPPITLGAAENAVWTEVAGLSREDMDDDSLNPAPTFVQRCRLVSGVLSGLRGIISIHSMASQTRRIQRRSGGPTASAFGARKPISRPPVEKSTVSGSTLSSNSYTLADASPSPVCSRVIDIPARDAGWQVLGVSLLDPPTSTRPSTD